MAEKIVIDGASPLTGEVRVDGDKSISHRSIMFGAIADGVTRVRNLLQGEDVLATIAAFRAMGVNIQEDAAGYEVQGVGLHGLSQPAAALDMGNSGTAFRLLTGLLCGQAWSSILTGDASLSARPMGRIIQPLSEMGAGFESREGKPPVTILPADKLSPIRYSMPMASAQVKSAVLLAGLYAEGETAVHEPAPTRDHTERMLRGFGYEVRREDDWVSLTGGGSLKACDIDVPADLSSATFFLMGALIAPGSDVVLPGVGVNPTRDGVLQILRRMSADIRIENLREAGGEPVADLRVKHSRLTGVEINADDVALAVDEIPSIAVAAACAEGVTHIRGAEELRVKESDRISTTVAGLRALGVSVEEHPDGMTITGGQFKGGEVHSEGDHRIAMAFAMAGNVTEEQVTVVDTACINTSFPRFNALAERAGMGLRPV